MTDYPRQKVLDQGYVQLVEAWGSDQRVIESARDRFLARFAELTGDGRLASKVYAERVVRAVGKFKVRVDLAREIVGDAWTDAMEHRVESAREAFVHVALSDEA